MALKRYILLVIGVLLISQTFLLTAQTILTKKKATLTIGFKAEREQAFTKSGGTQLSQSSFNPCIDLRKPICNRISVDASISYPMFKSADQKGGVELLPNLKNISVPVTLQYRLLPDGCKLRPYLGAGFQYKQEQSCCNSIANTEGRSIGNDNPDVKYISILFTQGITYEVSTKIELKQSFHFIPSNEKTIGFDIGIGYHLW